MNYYINEQLLARNLELIRKNKPMLFQRIKNHLNLGKWSVKIEKAKSGALTMFTETSDGKKNYFHSSFDPEKESSRFIESSQNLYTINDLTVFIGTGLGYHIKKYFEQQVYPQTLIIEPDINVLIAFLQIAALPENAKNWNIINSEDSDELQQSFSEAFNVLYMEKIRYMILPGFMRIYGGTVKKIQTYLTQSLDKSISQALTISYFGDIFQSNVINNFPILAVSPGVNSLKQYFTGKPAIIVSAGPSLDMNIEILAKNTDKFIIIAVDTTYGKLLAKKIIPHFTITIDPQHKSFFHIKNMELHNYFVTCLTASSRVVKHIEGRSFFFVSDYPLSLYFEGMTEPKGHFSTDGGSVANIALQFAEYIGASPIVLIGQDLSYPDFKSHCGNTMYEKENQGFSNKFSTLENRHFAFLENGISLKGIKSNTVYTSHQLLEYYRWFCHYVKTSKAEIVNAPYDGAYIDGIKHLDLKSVITEYNMRPVKNDMFGLNDIIKKYSTREKVNVIEKYKELKIQLTIFKQSFNSSKYKFKTISDLDFFLNTHSGVFELIKTLSFSKGVKLMRKLIGHDDIEKIRTLINVISESLEYSLSLIDAELNLKNTVKEQ